VSTVSICELSHEVRYLSQSTADSPNRLFLASSIERSHIQLCSGSFHRNSGSMVLSLDEVWLAPDHMWGVTTESPLHATLNILGFGRSCIGHAESCRLRPYLMAAVGYFMMRIEQTKDYGSGAFWRERNHMGT